MTSHGAGLLTVVCAQRTAQSPTGVLTENCGTCGAPGAAAPSVPAATAGGGAAGAGAGAGAAAALSRTKAVSGVAKRTTNMFTTLAIRIAVKLCSKPNKSEVGRAPRLRALKLAIARFEALQREGNGHRRSVP